MKSARCDFISKKVRDCGSDQKATFRIIKDLFHKCSGAQYPDHDSINSLVEDFGDYFIGKIKA